MIMAELEIRPTAGMRARISGVILISGTIVGAIVWLLTGGGVGLFAQKVDLKTYLPDATGLAPNAAVRLDGIQVGAVKRIAISGYLDRQRAVRVDLRVDRSYLSKIPADSLTSIDSETMIGDKYVDIAPGKSAAIVGDGAELTSEPLETAADKADLLYGLQDSLHKVDSMLTQLASPDNPVGHYMIGEEEYDKALSSLVVFERDMRKLVGNDTTAGAMVFTSSLYEKMQKPLRDFDGTLQSIQRGEGTAGHLFASDEQYSNILAELRDLRKTIADFRAGMDKSGPGLRDEATYDKVRRMLASTDAALAALNRGDGGAGELLNSPQLYESLVGSLQELQDLVHDFGTHPKKYLRTKLF